jgi:hypothetical protein
MHHFRLLGMGLALAGNDTCFNHMRRFGLKKMKIRVRFLVLIGLILGCFYFWESNRGQVSEFGESSRDAFPHVLVILLSALALFGLKAKHPVKEEASEDMLKDPVNIGVEISDCEGPVILEKEKGHYLRTACRALFIPILAFIVSVGMSKAHALEAWLYLVIFFPLFLATPISAYVGTSSSLKAMRENQKSLLPVGLFFLHLTFFLGSVLWLF